MDSRNKHSVVIKAKVSKMETFTLSFDTPTVTTAVTTVPIAVTTISNQLLSISKVSSNKPGKVGLKTKVTVWLLNGSINPFLPEGILNAPDA